MLHSSTTALVDSFDVALVDLDGTCYRGDELIEHADTAIAAAKDAGMAIVYVTNNASRPGAVVAEHLTRIGIPSQADDIVTSAQGAVAHLATLIPAGSKVLGCGGKEIFRALDEAGFQAVTTAADQPVAVIQGMDKSIGWPQLTEALNAIANGAIHVATNIDSTMPLENGMGIGAGSLVAAVAHAVGQWPPHTGKPEPNLFHMATERVGNDSAIIIGDRLNTDIAGGNNAGHPTLHVLTGIDGVREVALAHTVDRPNFLGRDMRDLLIGHDAPRKHSDPQSQRIMHTLGGYHADVRNGVVHLNDAKVTPQTQLDMDAYRVIVAAAWEATDRGEDIHEFPTLAVTDR